jgi:transposase-like protein
MFMSKDQREMARKIRILQHADDTGHVAKTCRYFGVGRSSFYRWRKAYRKHGEGGLAFDAAAEVPKWCA